jgi:hypothetical protein
MATDSPAIALDAMLHAPLTLVADIPKLHYIQSNQQESAAGILVHYFCEPREREIEGENTNVRKRRFRN